MLAFIGNLSLREIIVIMVIAVLVFGRRLPQVVGQAMHQLRRLQRALEALRRETGIEREIHSIRDSVEEAARQAQEEQTEAAPYAEIPPRSTDGPAMPEKGKVPGVGNDPG